MYLNAKTVSSRGFEYDFIVAVSVFGVLVFVVMTFGLFVMTMSVGGFFVMMMAMVVAQTIVFG